MGPALPIAILTGLLLGGMTVLAPVLAGSNLGNMWLPALLFALLLLVPVRAAARALAARPAEVLLVAFVILFQTAALHTFGPVDANDLLVLGVAAGLLAQAVVAGRPLVISPGLILSLPVFAAIVLAATHAGPVGLLGGKQILKCILVVFVFTNLIRDPAALELAIRAVITVTAFSALVAILQELVFVTTGFVATMNIEADSLRYLFEETPFGRMFRVTGLNTSYKHFTFFLTSGVLLTVSLLVAGGPRPAARRRWLWLAAGLMSAALVLTFSKDALLGLGAGLLLVLLLARTLNLFQLAVGGAAVALLLLATDLGREVGDKIASDIGSGELRIRLQLARDGIEGIMNQYPWFGVGVNQSIRYTGDFNNWVPHNNLIVTAAETGLIGLATYLSLMAYLVYAAWRTWLQARAPEQSAIALGLLGAAVSVLVSLQFHGLYTVTMLWMLLALVEVTGSLRQGGAAGAGAEQTGRGRE